MTERGTPCSSSTGPTHYAGCACHEAAWSERLAAAEERVRRLEEALVAIQWSATDGYGLTCPECDQAKEYGHAPDCRIGMALAPPPDAAVRGEGKETKG